MVQRASIVYGSTVKHCVCCVPVYCRTVRLLWNRVGLLLEVADRPSPRGYVGKLSKLPQCAAREVRCRARQCIDAEQLELGAEDGGVGEGSGEGDAAEGFVGMEFLTRGRVRGASRKNFFQAHTHPTKSHSSPRGEQFSLCVCVCVLGGCGPPIVMPYVTQTV